MNQAQSMALDRQDQLGSAHEKDRVKSGGHSAPVAMQQPEVDVPGNPRRWSDAARVFFSLGAIVTTFAVTGANSIYIASIPGVEARFRISQTLAISPITLYSIGFAIGPMIGTAGSEVFGRQYLFKGLLLLSLVFTIIGGSATRFRTLAAARVVAGLAGAPCGTIAAGIINDIWDLSQGEPLSLLIMLLYALSMSWSAELGPPIGEAIVRDRDWRWTFWLAAMLLGLSLLMTLPMPETFRPKLIRRHATAEERLPQEVAAAIYTTISRPLHMLLFEPIVLPTALLVTVSQTVLFAFYVAYPVILRTQYGFSNYAVGLAFLGLFVGSIFALPIMVVLDKVRQGRVGDREARAEPEIGPEEKLWGAMIGSVATPISLFWFAWTARSATPWVVPVLAGGLYGCSFTLVQVSIPIYKNDSFGATYGASALAADTFLRYLVSSVVPLFFVQMINRLTYQWAVSCWGFICLAVAPVPWIIYKFGPRLRARSRYST